MSNIENFGSSAAAPIEGITPPIESDKNTKKTKEKKANLNESSFSIRQKASHDLAQSSLHGSLKPTESKPDLLGRKPGAEPEAAQSMTPPIAEQSPAVPVESAEQTAIKPAANELEADTTVELRRIADEHLEDIEQAGPQVAAELAPAIPFLELVRAGVEPAEAFQQAADEFGFDSAAIESIVKQDPVGDEMYADPVSVPSDAEAVPEPTAGSDSDPIGPRNLYRPTGSPEEPGQPSATPAANSRSVLPTMQTRYFNSLPPAAGNYYRRRQAAGGTLLGGAIAGYELGKRAGRKQAEKRAAPTEKKLTQQVQRLEREITVKEQQLVVMQSTETETIKPPLKPAEAKPVSRRQESDRPLERTQPGRQETRLGMQKPERAEHLGHVAIATEAPTKIVERTRFVQPNNIRQAFRPEAVKSMPRSQLLELSEKVTVEGASLRHIYESSLITEKQLRHLVGEYLDGKDIRHELQRQMVEREIDFERDPQLRDRIRSTAATKDGGSLSQLLHEAGISTDDTTALTKQEQRRVEKQATADQKAKRRRRTADGAMVTAIVLLAIVVIVLLMR